MTERVVLETTWLFKFLFRRKRIGLVGAVVSLILLWVIPTRWLFRARPTRGSINRGGKPSDL